MNFKNLVMIIKGNVSSFDWLANDGDINSVIRFPWGLVNQYQLQLIESSVYNLSAGDYCRKTHGYPGGYTLQGVSTGMGVCVCVCGDFL